MSEVNLCDNEKKKLVLIPIEENDKEVHKPCINCEDGCEEWAGCPCMYYKAETEDKK